MKNTTVRTANGIQWDKSVAAFFYDFNIKKNSNYLNINSLPLNKECYFQDDIWDFSENNNIGYNKNIYFYNFNNVDFVYKDYLKEYVLTDMFINENSIETVYTHFHSVKKFISFLSENRIYQFNMINKDIIDKYLSNGKYSYIATARYKREIKNLINIIQRYNQYLDFSDTIEYLNLIDYSKLNSELENNKFDMIPLKIYNKIVSFAVKNIKKYINLLENGDKLKQYEIISTMSCCMVVILAETGMRIGEFHKLEVDKLIKIQPKGEKDFYYLEFLTYKTSPKSDGHWTFTFMTENAVLAYNSLLKLTSKYRKDSKYLYISSNGDLYYATDSLNKHMHRFFALYQNDLGLRDMSVSDKKYFSSITLDNDKQIRGWKGVVNKSDYGLKIYYATAHQFRVTVATVLYKRGYSLEFIRRHMNHMSEVMTEHYLRLEEITKREANIIEAIMHRASNEGDSLETDKDKTDSSYIKEELNLADYKEAYESINVFLKKLNNKRNNKINLRVMEDVKQLLELFKSRNPLTETELGYCVRDSLIQLCERQQYISTVNDGYYMAPHIPTIESLIFNYKRFKEKLAIINHNEKICKENNKYLNEFQREVKGLKKFIQKRFKPELELLKNEINIKGVEYLISKNDDINEIINNIELIEREVERWIKKIV